MVAWRETHRGRLWLVPPIWALAAAQLEVGIIVGGVAVLIWLFAKPAQDRPPSARTQVGVSPPVGDVEQRLTLLERRLDAFVNELAALKRDVATRSRPTT